MKIVDFDIVWACLDVNTKVKVEVKFWLTKRFWW